MSDKTKKKYLELFDRPYGRRLVFAAFAGEPWDYMGSKRFLWELESGSAATAGLSLQSIDQVTVSTPRCCFTALRCVRHGCAAQQLTCLHHLSKVLTADARSLQRRRFTERRHVAVTALLWYILVVQSDACAPAQVVELGQVGKAVSASSDAADYFVHSQRGSSYGDADLLERAFSAAAAAVSDLKVPISSATMEQQPYHCRL